MSTPATVQVWESNTVAETPTHITGLDFGSIDAPNLVAADHPLVIPVSGFIESYQKWTRWKVTAWVDTTAIDNFKWFKSAGSVAAGWQEYNSTDSNPTFVTPARNATGLASSAWPTSAGTAQAITGSISNPTIGYSSYARMVVVIGDVGATNPGYKGQHTLTYRYDES